MMEGVRADPRSQINVTPLVDVVLVLLIIFMTITPLLQEGYTVSVPLSGPRPPEPASQQIIVSFTSRGEIFLNRQRTSASELAARLPLLLKNRSESTVFLSAEDDANYGETVQLMDIIRGAGGRIGIIPGEALPVD
jgi:biopolymer transport protein TolR